MFLTLTLKLRLKFRKKTDTVCLSKLTPEMADPWTRVVWYCMESRHHKNDYHHHAILMVWCLIFHRWQWLQVVHHFLRDGAIRLGPRGPDFGPTVAPQVLTFWPRLGCYKIGSLLIFGSMNAGILGSNSFKHGCSWCSLVEIDSCQHPAPGLQIIPSPYY